MESAVIEQESQISEETPPLKAPRNGIDRRSADSAFRLAVWVAGLDSFLSGGGISFSERGASNPGGDYVRELRLARTALQRCSTLAFRIITSNDGSLLGTNISPEEMFEFALAIRDPLLMADSLNRSDSLEIGGWHAWCKVFIDKLKSVPAYAKLVELTESGGEEELPEALRELLSNGSGDLRPEFDVILPRFGRILRLLNIVGEMLEADEPLKPALIIFAKIGEMTQDLITYLNHRVERSDGSNDEFMGSLDGASYMASIELKKVLQQELAGLTSIRPATAVYARTEAAHALLTESFQHILTGFARQIEPQIDAFALFPTFGVKLERSLALRQELYSILTLVQSAEKDPDKRKISEMNKALLKYMDDSVAFLFYKDTETLERFVEEILITRQKKDLVPILHRFGAYLETLFAQVNMRAVLENYPFVKS